MLVNVGLIDKEKAEKNVELKKKKPDYKPYEEEESVDDMVIVRIANSPLKPHMAKVPMMLIKQFPPCITCFFEFFLVKAKVCAVKV